MKKLDTSKRLFAICLATVILLTGCQNKQQQTSQPIQQTSTPTSSSFEGTTSSSSSSSLNYNDNKDVWRGTQITDPNNIQKFEQLVDRIVTNLNSYGIEVIDDSVGSGATQDPSVTPGIPSFSSSDSGNSGSGSGESGSGSGDSGSGGGAVLPPIVLPGQDTSTGDTSTVDTSSEGTTSSGIQLTSAGITTDTSSAEGESSSDSTSSTEGTSEGDDKSNLYLELDELYAVYQHLFATDTGDDKVSFDRKMALIASYLNPEEKYSESEIFEALRDSWYANHTTWVPSRWEVIINSNTTKDDYPLAPSGIYEKDYLESNLNLLALLGIMFNCPSDSEVKNAPKLNNWTITSGTTTNKLYSSFADKAKEWGLEGRQIDKIINGMGTAKLPILTMIERYETENPDEKGKDRDVEFDVDKTDYFNYFYTFDNNGWATTSYKRQNALQITLWQFMTKVSSHTTKDTPALAAYLKDNIGNIYNEMLAIMADPTGNYTPKFDAAAITEAEASRWYQFELDEKRDGAEEIVVVPNSSKRYSVTWDSYSGYVTYLDSNYETNAASLQGVIDGLLSVNSANPGTTLDRTDAGSSGGSVDMSAYDYMIKDLAMENGDPIAWTAFVKYIHDGMLEEDENGLALYKGAWKELNDIIKIEDTSFESVFYALQEDDEVAYSNYGVIFGSGIPATLACNSSGGKGTYDWQMQWVFPEGRIKLSELRETLLDYIVLVGAFTETNYTNALDIALSGAINKASSNGYVFGIDYVKGSAMLTIAKV